MTKLEFDITISLISINIRRRVKGNNAGLLNNIYFKYLHRPLHVRTFYSHRILQILHSYSCPLPLSPFHISPLVLEIQVQSLGLDRPFALISAEEPLSTG